jgi:hypothetical protein
MDVYDELIRRNNNTSGFTIPILAARGLRVFTSHLVPFLPVQADFHFERNQTRQKLASLSNLRFKYLASDVFFELDRRSPECKVRQVREL